MAAEVFIIKSLLIQSAIMLGALGIIVFFLIRAVWQRQPKHIVIFSIWSCLVLAFFNSSLFGFSEVKVTPQGVGLTYGYLSPRNRMLPLHVDWRIESHRAGLRKTKLLYFLVIGGKESMRVRGGKGLELLNAIGESIDRMKAANPEEETAGKGPSVPTLSGYLSSLVTAVYTKGRREKVEGLSAPTSSGRVPGFLASRHLPSVY
jgi:hypothetical protein